MTYSLSVVSPADCLFLCSVQCQEPGNGLLSVLRVTAAIVFVCCKLCNAPGYVVKPSDVNNSQYVCDIARYF